MCRTIGASPAPLTKESQRSRGRLLSHRNRLVPEEFPAAAKDAHRRVYIAFDGVMANSDVWINGFHLGHRPNGYVSFFYDLTGHVQFGPPRTT